MKTKDLKKIEELVDNLYWEYDRMSISGQETLYKLASLVFKNETIGEENENQ